MALELKLKEAEQKKEEAENYLTKMVRLKLCILCFILASCTIHD